MQAIPKGVDIATLMNQKDELTDYFINYIQQVKNYPQKYVIESNLIQRLTGIPPRRMNNLINPLFIKGISFSLTFQILTKDSSQHLWALSTSTSCGS